MARTILEIIKSTFPGLRFERRCVEPGRPDWIGYRTYILGNVRVFFFLKNIVEYGIVNTYLIMETRYRCFRDIEHKSVVELARIDGIPEHVLEHAIRSSVEKSVVELMRLMYERPLDETGNEN